MQTLDTTINWTAASANFILLTDSYKTSHWGQYPPGTEGLYSYLEARKGSKFPYHMSIGFQVFIDKYLKGVRITPEVIDEAETMIEAHMGPGHFNREGWEYIINTYGGRIPVKICAAPEGTMLPAGNVLCTVECEDPKVFWVVNYIETMLLNVWGMQTVATHSHECRRILREFLGETADDEVIEQVLPFMLHDFGCRGVMCPEQAALAGFGHLASFMGTDTIPALGLARDYYDEECAGFSVPASEHSTMCSWGEENEVDAYTNMLERYPTGIVSIVSDSWDIFNAVENIFCGVLAEKIEARDGKTVIRPDSGDPIEQCPWILEKLGNRFGYTMNSKGYKVLSPKVGLLWGDGIDMKAMIDICNAVKAAGWSVQNLVFGMGGGLLQRHNRDTQRMAFKASAIKIDGQWRDVFKRPASDPSKNSLRGRLALMKQGDTYLTRRKDVTDSNLDILQVVFNGTAENQTPTRTTLAEIRQRASA